MAQDIVGDNRTISWQLVAANFWVLAVKIDQPPDCSGKLCLTSEGHTELHTAGETDLTQLV